MSYCQRNCCIIRFLFYPWFAVAAHIYWWALGNMRIAHGIVKAGFQQRLSPLKIRKCEGKKASFWISNHDYTTVIARIITGSWAITPTVRTTRSRTGLYRNSIVQQPQLCLGDKASLAASGSPRNDQGFNSEKSLVC